jgi:hypothetical protein
MDGTLMLSQTLLLEKFPGNGGWTYVELKSTAADQLRLGSYLTKLLKINNLNSKRCFVRQETWQLRFGFNHFKGLQLFGG